MRRRTTFERSRRPYPAPGLLVQFLVIVNITLLGCVVSAGAWWLVGVLWGPR